MAIPKNIDVEKAVSELSSQLTNDFQLDAKQRMHLFLHLTCLADLVQGKVKYDKIYGFRPAIEKKIK